tara:strand:- start:709 stop:828 length:120 start_codon:yes stop_codon:yes gene_type:complete
MPFVIGGLPAVINTVQDRLDLMVVRGRRGAMAQMGGKRA